MVFLCGFIVLVVFVIKGVVKLALIFILPILGVIASALTGTILEMLGRGSDLSGRTEIWQAASRIFLERPLLGHGYGSATMGGFTPYIISRFKAQNVHNGYIDLALSSGAIGSLIFYLALAWAGARAIRVYKGGHDGALAVATVGTFTIGWLVSCLSEVSLRPNMPMGAMGIASLLVLATLSPSPAVDDDRSAA